MDDIDSSPFLSGYTYRTFASQAICDKNDTKYMKAASTGIDPDKVEDVDLLYVTGEQVENFLRNIAPKIKCSFSMVTAMWDAGVSQHLADMLPDNLSHWWTINANVYHEKITPIPLGLGNKNWGWDGNIQTNPETYHKYIHTPKTEGVFASFSVHNRHGERLQCLNDAKHKLPDLRVRGFTPADRKSDTFVDNYFQEVSQYKMVLCPWGAGYDTHRLWETLYLGSIPITRWCVAYRGFEDYPIIFIHHWSDLDMDFLMAEYEKKVEQLKSETRIYSAYWKDVLCGY